MHFVYTTVDGDGTAWLHVQRSNGVLDLVAAAIYTANDSVFCGAGRHCLLAPPAWTYRLGGHYRHSLGGLLWHLGQWAYRRFYGMTQLSSHELTHEELIDKYGWDEAFFTEE